MLFLMRILLVKYDRFNPHVVKDQHLRGTEDLFYPDSNSFVYITAKRMPTSIIFSLQMRDLGAW